MKEVSINGVDLTKQVFQLHGATAEGEVIVAEIKCQCSLPTDQFKQLDTLRPKSMKPTITSTGG